jgi:hypothetical protein
MNHRTEEQGTRNDEGKGKCSMFNILEGTWAFEKVYR